MDWISEPSAWVAFFTLAALEIVLGIDNVVFISILAGKLPEEQRSRARRIGLAMALIGRLVLLLSLSWILRLTKPLFTVLGQELSGRDLILMLGGLFLLAKATREIHATMEGEGDEHAAPVQATFRSVILQILAFDIIFSLDSVITAVGMVEEIGIMVAAVVFSMAIMVVSVGAVSRFIESHPTVKMLALSFLLLVGMALVAESLDLHIPRGYIYFAMAFSVFVEALNLRVRRPPPRASGPS